MPSSHSLGSQSALTDPEKLSDYDQETLVKLVGQKLELYEWCVREFSCGCTADRVELY